MQYIKKVKPFEAVQWTNQDINEMPEWLKSEFEDKELVIVKGIAKYNSIDGYHIELDDNSDDIFVVRAFDGHEYNFEYPTIVYYQYCPLGGYIEYVGHDVDFYRQKEFEDIYMKYEK